MARNQIDGDQVQDESLTGSDILDSSVQIIDLEDYSFATLTDVEVTSLSKDDLVVYSESLSKFVNKRICDINLFYKRIFTLSDGNIKIPQGKVLQMHSPSIECEVEISGELYIL